MRTLALALLLLIVAGQTSPEFPFPTPRCNADGNYDCYAGLYLVKGGFTWNMYT